MKISLSPMRSNTRLQAELDGDVLTLNGEAFDLSGIPEGATLPQSAVTCRWLASDIERRDGILHLTLILPHGPIAVDGTGVPHETLFPATIEATDGPVALPPYVTIQGATE